MSDTPRELARGYAEEVLAWHSGLGLEYQRGVLGALVEVGVMSAEERIGWQARWDRASAPLGPPPPEVATLARELLEREFEGTPDPLAADQSQQRNRIFTALQTLRGAGVVTGAEHAEWQQRLDHAFPRKQPPPAPYAAARLRGAAIGPDLRRGGLRIISVECFEDCVLVRWHLAVHSDAARSESVHVHDRAHDLVEAHAPNTLEDALGTRYTAVQPRSWELEYRWIGEDPSVLLSTTAFIPGAPAAAGRLVVGCPAGTFEIDCPPTEPPRPESASEPLADPA